MAFVPDANGETNPVPAATVHFGSRSNEFFVGFLFTSNDEVRFPGRARGSGGFRVARANQPDFSIRSSGHFWKNLYLGVQIGGKRQSESAAQVASTPLVAYLVVSAKPDTIAPSDTAMITVTARDAQHRILSGQAISVTSDNPDVVAVGSDWVARAGPNPGEATITARSGSITGTTKVIVKKRS